MLIHPQMSGGNVAECHAWRCIVFLYARMFDVRKFKQEWIYRSDCSL